MKKLIPSTIPQSGTWFLPDAISFPRPPGRGRIEDRPADEVGGDPTEPRFDFQHLNGHRPPSRAFHREDRLALATEVDASPP
jgi:hypothetical protein